MVRVLVLFLYIDSFINSDEFRCFLCRQHLNYFYL